MKNMYNSNRSRSSTEHNTQKRLKWTASISTIEHRILWTRTVWKSTVLHWQHWMENASLVHSVNRAKEREPFQFSCETFFSCVSYTIYGYVYIYIDAMDKYWVVLWRVYASCALCQRIFQFGFAVVVVRFAFARVLSNFPRNAACVLRYVDKQSAIRSRKTPIRCKPNVVQSIWFWLLLLLFWVLGEWMKQSVVKSVIVPTIGLLENAVDVCVYNGKGKARPHNNMGHPTERKSIWWSELQLTHTQTHTYSLIQSMRWREISFGSWEMGPKQCIHTFASIMYRILRHTHGTCNCIQSMEQGERSAYTSPARSLVRSFGMCLWLDFVNVHTHCNVEFIRSSASFFCVLLLLYELENHFQCSSNG